MFLTFQSYDFDAFAHGPFGCRMTVQSFVKIVWTVFEKFEIFMKRLGEKKQHDCISSQKFFPTPKKEKVQTEVPNMEVAHMVLLTV